MPDQISPTPFLHVFTGGDDNGKTRVLDSVFLMSIIWGED